MVAAMDPVTRHAEQFAALGAEPRLRILRLLLCAHPGGMTVGEIQEQLDIPGSTLSHHLDRLRQEELVEVRRDRQFLWYSAHTGTLKQLIAFLYAECCTRSRAVPANSLVELWASKPPTPSAKGRTT
jgi:DNA-binding transcriptional ArsR family regulator